MVFLNRDPRYGWERGSARGQMQKLPAGKFHGVPPEMIKSPFEKAGCVVEIDMIPGAANAKPRNRHVDSSH